MQITKYIRAMLINSEQATLLIVISDNAWRDENEIASHSERKFCSNICISEIVTPVTHLPGRAHLRSAKNGDYDIPRVLSGFGQRSFSVSGPDAWNSLPRQLRGITVASTFKRHLKSELFFQAYGVSTIASTVADPWDCLHYWLMLFFIYDMCVFFIFSLF